jgi:RNA polymerase sigma-70 factor (ECF subfamily)
MEHLGIDAIAALHGVHRSTAARWLQGVRERLGKHIRRSLRERLGPRPRDIESVLRAVDSQLDLSFSRLLG